MYQKEIYLLSEEKCNMTKNFVINADSFKEIYNTHFYDICRFLNYYTRDICIIEEVVQDLFTTLWEERFNVKIEYIKTYLYKGARNRMLNYLRDDSNRKLLMEQWAKTTYENRNSTDCINREAFSDTLSEALNFLPEKCKEIFLLSRKDRLSYKEIAQVKNISVKTVENQMGIALRKIRNYFFDHFPENV